SEMKPVRAAGTVATRQGRRSAALVQQMSAVRKQTERLLQRNQQLRHELSTVCLASESMRVRANRLVALARLAASPADDVYRIANKPPRRSPPHLVVLPGGGYSLLQPRRSGVNGTFSRVGSFHHRIDTLNAGRYRQKQFSPDLIGATSPS